MLACKVVCLLKQKRYLRTSHNSDRDRGNEVIFSCGGFGVAIIWMQNASFLFDSHSQNAAGLHKPSGMPLF